MLALSLCAPFLALLVAEAPHGTAAPRCDRRGVLVRLLVWLLVANVVQVVVGIVQSRTGLPPLLVGIHMFLACVVVALMASTATTFRRVADKERLPVA